MKEPDSIKRRTLTRRDFLRAVVAAGSLALARPRSVWSAPPHSEIMPGVDGISPRRSGQAFWYRGNLHAHSQWSDGKDMPECLLAAYKQRGYHFFSLTDHNLFQGEALRFEGYHFIDTPSDLRDFAGASSFWKRVMPEDGWPFLTESHLENVRQMFGADAITSRTVDGKMYVRLKTYAELEAQFAEPGRFLMIPGYEQTGAISDGESKQSVHMNFLNVNEVFPYIQAETPLEILRQTFARGQELYGKRDEPYLFTANHPLWRYYDWGPEELISLPEIRFFELTNNGISNDTWELQPGAWTPETLWDTVNAYRATHDQPLLYATGTDDAHDIHSERSWDGWMVVRSPELTTRSLFSAMQNGDFYASTGADFEDIRFDGSSLFVRALPEENATYRIDFIGTRRGYDATKKTLELPREGKRPPRTVDLYSSEIGVTLQSTEGLEASYTLTDDDLYVRAKLTRIQPPALTVMRWRTHPAAWTQPYRKI